MNNHRARGFSIVELLIAVTLGLILTAGLISIFVSSKQGYRVQESRARMQESARFAMDFLSRSIRLADFWGSAPPTRTTNLSTPSYTGTGGCSNGWLVSSIGILGHDGAGTLTAAGRSEAEVDLPNDCISNYVANSDVVTVRYALPDSAITNANLTANQFFVRALVGGKAILFNGSEASDAVTNLPDDAGVPGKVLNYPFRVEKFYIGAFSPTGGGADVPTLYVTKNNTSEATPTPLIEGIEMMQLEYGVDSNNDRVVDGYRSASNVGMSAAEWRKVLSVRIGLIVRGDERDTFTDNDTYPMPGGYTYTPATADRRFQRIQVVREVQIRNRVTFR